MASENMGVARDLRQETDGQGPEAGPSGEPRSVDSMREEVVSLLVRRRVPDKAEIMRVKMLVRDLARRSDPRPPKEGEVKDFISAYLDLNLGRMAGKPAIEEASLRRCLGYLGLRDAATRASESAPER